MVLMYTCTCIQRVCGGSLSYRLREIVGIGTIKTLATVVFCSCFAAERVFSLLNASFGACQANTLEDYQRKITKSCNHATIQQMLVTFFLHTLCMYSYQSSFLQILNIEHNRQFLGA